MFACQLLIYTSQRHQASYPTTQTHPQLLLPSPSRLQFHTTTLNPTQTPARRDTLFPLPYAGLVTPANLSRSPSTSLNRPRCSGGSSSAIASMIASEAST